MEFCGVCGASTKGILGILGPADHFDVRRFLVFLAAYYIVQVCTFHLVCFALLLLSKPINVVAV